MVNAVPVADGNQFLSPIETVIETFDDRYLKPAASPINYESEQNRGKYSNRQSSIRDLSTHVGGDPQSPIDVFITVRLCGAF